MPKLTPEQLDKHADLDPRTHPWGIQTSDAFVLSTPSIFFWFATEAELRESILNGSHDLKDDPEEWAAASPKLESALGAIETLTPEHATALSAAAESTFNIDWIGEFAELRTGDSDSALWVRESFRNSDEDEPADLKAPILNDEVEDFVYMLKEVGI